MLTSILRLLKENSAGYLSGEEIASKLSLSQAAVLKYINSLKAEGFAIQSKPQQGFRLCGMEDLLLPDEILPKLTTKIIGRHMDYITCTDSTNNAAKSLAIQGCPEGQAVVAEKQTGGKGRLTRSWFSPIGKGIWLSVVLRPPFCPQDAPKCTLMAAVAVNRAINRVANVAAKIKWPNDILVGGKKIVGILTEMSAMESIDFVVIGIGVNVNIAAADFPPEVENVATSLATAAGRTISRTELLAEILQELDAAYLSTLEKGFLPTLNEWRSMSGTLGQIVTVSGDEPALSGEAIDIDEDGALLIMTPTGIKKVIAGDVSVRLTESE